MDHAKRGGDHKAIPISGSACPADIVSEERVICGVRVHYSVAPDGRCMKHGVLVANGVLDLVDQEHVRVVVLLQELEVKSFVSLTLEDFHESAQPIFLATLFSPGSEHLLDPGRVGLTLLLDDVERNLIGDQVLVLIVRGYELFKQDCRALWQVQVELALSNLVVVMIVAEASLLRLVHLEDHLEHFSTEFL